jgi:hypothetical protein
LPDASKAAIQRAFSTLSVCFDMNATPGPVQGIFRNYLPRPE